MESEDNSNNLLEKDKQIEILSTSIKFLLNKFDETAVLKEKKKCLDELKVLLEKYNKLNEKVKSNFYTSSTSVRRTLKKKLTLSHLDVKNFNELYSEKENLYKILSEKKEEETKEENPLSFELDETNLNILDYSRTKMIFDEAESTYNENEEFIKNIQNLIQEKPIIDPNDEAYKSYLKFTTLKNELSKENRIKKIKKCVLGFILFLIILGICLFIFVEEE
ncbi:MAG: hypothetical protein MJ252_00490 [archaeon]|nr:hypothetical protein [archaeon]